ncbi:MAG TPA: hypothetical protein VKT22_03655 [Steroidobacteraceae bacterium]|nr:hypothetical protein [Steroidobacteraceae bacterium]
MQASLAFLDSAGTRKEASLSIDAAFFQILNLLRTGYATRPVRAAAARRGARAPIARRRSAKHTSLVDCAPQ